MLIINPISGTGGKKGVVDMVEEAMAKCGHEVDVGFPGGLG
jgi:diacylglycerol kinase family enzyme